jgi:hypothetical protein
MKSPNKAMPIGMRVAFFIFGAFFAVCTLLAIHRGKILHKTDAEPSGFITQSGEPVLFWALVIFFLVFSLVLFYGAFAKR